MNEEVQILVGADVNFVRVGNQIDINFTYGSPHDYKYANLQIEVPFKLRNREDTRLIDPEKLDSLPPLIKLLRTRIEEIKLTDELTIGFSNGMSLSVGRIEKYEAWHIGGGDIPQIIAQGV